MTAPTTAPAATTPSRKAWNWIALWPAGILAGVVVLYVVAGLLGVTVEPASGHAPLPQRIVVLGATSIVWLIAPVFAFLRAMFAVRVMKKARSARAALVVAIAELGFTLAMAIDTIIHPGNMV
jgi:hypothetical protein